ncbi:MAG: YadA C-terminal domain-containing protein [Pseudomonadota bacterium]|nr:YadA C-terminal domain-containing protein [Pseudomonadota bacterium]
MNSAKGYTDTREAAITAAYTAADTITLNTAKDYTDTREVAITAAYTAADTDTLNSAKSYTDDATFMKTDGNNFNEGDSVISAIKSLDNASGDQSQFANSRYLDANMTSADAIMSLDRNLDSVDHRIRTMEKEMKGGFASVAALSALAPNARANGNTQIALGTGIYRDHQGLAIGAYHYFDDNILANIGASYAGDKSAMLRAGVTFGW